LAIEVLVGVSVLALNFGLTTGTCGPGRIVAVQNDTATPLLLIKSPYNAQYGNFSRGSLPVENGSKILTLSSWNGSVWGYFDRTDWIVKAGQSRSGSSLACSQTFCLIPNDNVTSTIAPSYDQTVLNFVNDSTVPTAVQFNASNPPVFFNGRFSKMTDEVST
jgi:hypothetical protein